MEQRTSIKTFMPMIVMYIVVIALTIGKQIILPASHHHMHESWSFYVLMMDFMGIMFLVSALLKFVSLRCFVMAYRKYDLIAKRSTVYAYAYPFIECALGIAYLADWQIMFISWFTLILMLVNAAGIALTLYRQEEAECGCMGTTIKMPLTTVTLWENLFMAAMAVMMLWM